MKNLLRSTISGLALSVFLTGCGENFQADYTGTAQIVPTTNACVIQNQGPYKMTVHLSINSSNATMNVTQFISTITQSADNTTQEITQAAMIGSLLNGGTQFSDSNQVYANSSDTVNATANISSDRSQITAFSFQRNSTGLTGTACTFQVKADLLNKNQ